jgi:hypothetical protein
MDQVAAGGGEERGVGLHQLICSAHHTYS